jgi:glutathione S-transferase
MPITLYDMHESPHARKVRLLAAELDIPLALVARDPRVGETRGPDYLALNPNGRVPTLVEDGFALWESSAILKYLSAKRPERGLSGATPEDQAHVDQWLFWWVGGPEPAIDALAWEQFIKPKVLKQPATIRTSSPTPIRASRGSCPCSTGSSTTSSVHSASSISSLDRASSEAPPS